MKSAQVRSIHATMPLKRTNAELRRSMIGSNGEAVRLKRIRDLNRNITRNNNASSVPGTVVSESIEHRAKPKED